MTARIGQRAARRVPAGARPAGGAAADCRARRDRDGGGGAQLLGRGAVPAGVPVPASARLGDRDDAGRTRRRRCRCDLFGYVIGWAGFAVACPRAGRPDRARKDVAAVHRRLELVQRGAVPDAGRRRGAGAAGRATVAGADRWLVAMGWALWLEWYASRLALDVPGGAGGGVRAARFRARPAGGRGDGLSGAGRAGDPNARPARLTLMRVPRGVSGRAGIC